MTKTISFSQQNDTGSRAHTRSPLEKLVVIQESKALHCESHDINSKWRMYRVIGSTLTHERCCLQD